ncbi:sugar phosphate nucleotidyltransferase [Paenibacillus ginsengihumi]|uniref:sugar phosphate nucleotidyltransferase n=1 Tax=Paenibacillus ginsengihumi TaxID=431596 RepID=UPI00036F93AF|nr:sugar phosphate nucleotidyltransferase [Paenibacillus ginsengihumi]
MKGIILAGGTGTRLRPMTNIINKHLLPVGKYPMIHYAIHKMTDAGVNDILLITGKQSAGIYAEYIGSGEAFGARVSYRVQEHAGGIAHALEMAEAFVAPREKLLVLLGDNLFEDSLRLAVEEFCARGEGAHVFLKKVDDPKAYGVPEIVDGRIVKIVEKPDTPSCDYAVTGLYMYDSSVFDIIRTLKPSARGEMEITDVNNVYARQGKLTHSMLCGWWTDAGTHNALLEAGTRMIGRDEA